MVGVRGGLLLALSLATASTCNALLAPGSLARSSSTARGGARRSAQVSRIASWRGGAIENAGGQPPSMNVQLGLVRVAGYGIIAGSLGLKTPQIARVWHAKSLVGLAPASIYADVFLFATSVIYHVLKRNPIRAYGESVIILFQTMIMVGLLWRFGVDEDVSTAGKNASSSALTAGGSGSGSVSSVSSSSSSSSSSNSSGTAAKKRPAGGGTISRTAIVVGSIVASVLCMRYLPERMWGLLVVVSTPTILAVQLPQMWKNWRQKHTGELALLTVLLAFLGSSVRVGTTIADLGGDPWLLFNYVLGAATNATLLAQIWMYRSRTEIVRRKVEGTVHGASPAA